MKTSVVAVTLLVMFNSAAVSQTVPGLYSGKPLRLMFEMKQTDENTVEFHDYASKERLLVIRKTPYVFDDDEVPQEGADYKWMMPHHIYKDDEVVKYEGGYTKGASLYSIYFNNGLANVIRGESGKTIATMRLGNLTVKFVNKRVRCMIFSIGNDQYGWTLKVNKTIVGMAHNTDPVDILTMLVHVVQTGLNE